MPDVLSNLYEWLTNDPIGVSVFSFIRNIIYLMTVLSILQVMVRHLFAVLNKGVGITDEDKVWDEIKKGNISAGLYLGFRNFGVLYLIASIAAAFIK